MPSAGDCPEARRIPRSHRLPVRPGERPAIQDRGVPRAGRAELRRCPCRAHGSRAGVLREQGPGELRRHRADGPPRRQPPGRSAPHRTGMCRKADGGHSSPQARQLESSRPTGGLYRRTRRPRRVPGSRPWRRALPMAPLPGGKEEGTPALDEFECKYASYLSRRGPAHGHLLSGGGVKWPIGPRGSIPRCHDRGPRAVIPAGISTRPWSWWRTTRETLSWSPNTSPTAP